MSQHEYQELLRSRTARKQFFFSIAGAVMLILLIRFLALPYAEHVLATPAPQPFHAEGDIGWLTLQITGSIPGSEKPGWLRLTEYVVDELLVALFTSAILAVAFVTLTPRVMAYANISPPSTRAR
jgi:hypothetical protein